MGKCLDSGWMEFPRASVVDFILRDRDLGKDPLQIQLWHDNSGKGEDACWYIDQIVLQKLADPDSGKRSQEPSYFICKQWLSVDKGDCLLVRTLRESLPDDGSGDFMALFFTSIITKLTEDHMWFSVFLRSSKSP